MNYRDQQLKKYMSSLSEIDKLLYLRKLVNASISNLKKKEKSVNAEFGFDYISAPKRTASNRGGKATSLTANAINCTQIYFSSLEDIKAMVKYL